MIKLYTGDISDALQMVEAKGITLKFPWSFVFMNVWLEGLHNEKHGFCQALSVSSYSQHRNVYNYKKSC